MFLITPKSTSASANQNNPTGQRPQNYSSTSTARAVRTHKACDRCRLKKIKCDGEKPCLRCVQDKVGCTLSMRRPNDPKESLRDYITSLESKQARLTDTLQRMCRNVGRRVVDSDVKDMMEVLKACGYTGEDLPPQDANNINITSRSISRIGTPMKRTRSNEFSDLVTPETSSKAPKLTSNSENTGQSTIHADDFDFQINNEEMSGSNTLYSDDYWDLDSYWNKVAYSQLLNESIQQTPASIPSQSTDASRQDMSALSTGISSVADWNFQGTSEILDPEINTSAVPTSVDDWTTSLEWD